MEPSDTPPTAGLGGDYIPFPSAAKDQSSDGPALFAGTPSFSARHKSKRNKHERVRLAHAAHHAATAVHAPDASSVDAPDTAEPWEMARPSKKSKKRKRQDAGSAPSHSGHDADADDDADAARGALGAGASTKPALVYADLHRLKAMVKLGDLQNLLLYCMADDVAPQWIGVRGARQVRKAVVLMVPGLERGMFTGEVPLVDRDGPGEKGDGQAEGTEEDEAVKVPCKPDGDAATASQPEGKNPDDYLPTPLSASNLPSALQPLAAIFDRLWPIRTPGDDKSPRLYSPAHSMLTAALPKGHQPDGRATKHAKGAEPSAPAAQRTRITAFLATPDELADAEYALHPALVAAGERPALLARRAATGQSAAQGWVDTAVEALADGNVAEADIDAGSVTAGRTVYAIDCEMCLAQSTMVLTRVSVVDWDGGVVMDEYVKPAETITDYLTPYSGITAGLLANVTTTLADIQTRLLALLHPRAILAGHSLESDLNALKLTHPFLLDTALLYPHPRGLPLRSSLKYLSQKYLHRAIQTGHGSSGHDSIEDARATLDLIKQKCEKGRLHGLPARERDSLFQRRSRSAHPRVALDSAGLAPAAGALVDAGDPARAWSAVYANFHLGAADDAGVVRQVQRAVQGDVDGAEIPGGGVDVVWARLRGLEAARGWAAPGERAPEAEAADLATATAIDARPRATDVARTVAHIQAIHACLPPCSLLLLYSGGGDARAVYRLQARHRAFRAAFAAGTKWDDLPVQWTDDDEGALRRACVGARVGIGFVGVT